MSQGGVAQAFERAVRLHQSGQLDEAKAMYRAILKALPDQHDALHLLGVLAAQQSQYSDAVKHFTRALKLQPRWPEALSNMGNALRSLKRHSEAMAAYRKALELRPDFGDALYNLGVALVELRRYDEAAEYFEKALAANPRDAGAHSNLGNLWLDAARFEEAAAEFRAALALDPSQAEAHSNLGVALRGLGRVDEAIASYRTALELDPGYAKAWSNLGNVLAETSRHREAIASLKRAIELEPDFANAHGNLGLSFTALGNYDEAVATFRRAQSLNPDDPVPGARLIFSLGLKPGIGFKEHADECRAWNERYTRPLARSIRKHPNARDPARKLRIGYVSSDFRRHSAAAAFGPMVRNHDRSQFEVVLYSGVQKEDDLTEVFRASTDLWRRTAGISDARLAEQIREDRVDILVDLASFSAGSRLLVFARKPAPIQATGWGYVVSTGLPTMDYLFCDPVGVPQEARRWYTETVVDLPCCVAFEPPDAAPEPAPPPSLAGAPLTFGSLNRLAKMSADAVRLWCRLLREMPDARMVLKDSRLSDPPERERVAGLFSDEGVDAGRLILLPGTSQREHLEAYGLVDVALDPFPHTGGVSTLEALWMGVPVVTLAGGSFPARVSASVLSALGLQEWVVEDDETYLALAKRLASEVERRSALRQRLREQVRGSVLCDGVAYCRAVEAEYRKMWQKYCAA